MARWRNAFSRGSDLLILVAGGSVLAGNREPAEPLGPLAGPEPYVEDFKRASGNYGPVPRQRPKTVGYFCDRYAY